MVLQVGHLLMTLHYKLNYKTQTAKLFAFILLAYALLLSLAIKAEPYLAIKNNLKCSACHVNPDGGGLRNEFGKIYGQQLLPAKASNFDSIKMAQVTQFLSIGADARFNANFQKTEEKNNNTGKSFGVESAQLYVNFKIPETGLSFYLDQQVAPGTAINREAVVMYTFGQGDFIKAGKLFLPYGLRIEDDSAFIKQATGLNFDNSDNGVEYGINVGNTTMNFFVANGTSQAVNNDDTFLYGARVEHLFSNFRLGSSAILNNGDNKVTMFNIYGGATWKDFTFLTEVDYLTLENSNNVTLPDSASDIRQLITLAEVNYQWQPGVNIKLTAEYFDPNRDINEDEQTRYSLVGEYTPISNIQLRLGLRFKQDIPQRPQQNIDLFFVQSHFYF